jgi:hypothetical protein
LSEFIASTFPNIVGRGFSGGPVFNTENKSFIGLTSFGQPGEYLGITPIKDVLSLLPQKNGLSA